MLEGIVSWKYRNENISNMGTTKKTSPARKPSKSPEKKVVEKDKKKRSSAKKPEKSQKRLRKLLTEKRGTLRLSPLPVSNDPVEQRLPVLISTPIKLGIPRASEPKNATHREPIIPMMKQTLS